MTGKGDRWGRDRIGRSEPAFLSTTALPPLTCTARGRRHLQLSFLLHGRPTVGRPFVVRPEPGGESAGCVCLQCLFCGLFACSPFACHAHCPHQFLPPFSLLQVALPRSFASLCFAPVHCPACQDRSGPAVCRRVRASSLQAARLSRWQLCNTGLQWRPVHRSI